jgi:hypothetical protein
VSTLLFGFVGGFIAWIATTVVGQPLLRFFQLRAQAAHILARYDDQPWIDNPEEKPPAEAWLAKRRQAYEEIGSELVAFADSNADPEWTLPCAHAHARVLSGNSL